MHVCVPLEKVSSPHWVSNWHSWDSWSKNSCFTFLRARVGCAGESVLSNPIRGEGLGKWSDERRGERDRTGRVECYGRGCGVIYSAVSFITVCAILGS